VVVAGGDWRDLGREEEGRGVAAHAAAAGVGEGADVRVAFDLVTAAGDERRDAAGAGQAETLRNPAQRDKPFFERKVCDEAALERAVLPGDRFEGRVEGLRHGLEDIFELRAAGMDLRKNRDRPSFVILEDPSNRPSRAWKPLRRGKDLATR
jgi:hypothetical protein